ncbi:MAG: exosortase-associated protein EpsI, V-type [Sphingomicrobium sp.]
MKPVFDSFIEPQVDRRKFLLGGVFAATAAFAQWRLPRHDLDRLGRQKLEDLVPKEIGDWKAVSNSGVVVPPNDPLLNGIYSQELTRVYADGKNPPIMLLMAQNGTQTGFLQVHRPDFCYRASGYQISAVSPHPINIGSAIVPASLMDATAGGPTEHVVFWTRVGDRIPQSWTQQKLVVAEQNLRGIIPDAILIRVSMINEDSSSALAGIDDFVRNMLASIPQDRRSVFIV